MCVCVHIAFTYLFIYLLNYLFVCKYLYVLACEIYMSFTCMYNINNWWLGQPSEKYDFVNWDDDIFPI